MDAAGCVQLFPKGSERPGALREVEARVLAVSTAWAREVLGGWVNVPLWIPAAERAEEIQERSLRTYDGL